MTIARFMTDLCTIIEKTNVELPSGETDDIEQVVTTHVPCRIRNMRIAEGQHMMSADVESVDVYLAMFPEDVLLPVINGIIVREQDITRFEVTSHASLHGEHGAPMTHWDFVVRHYG